MSYWCKTPAAGSSGSAGNYIEKLHLQRTFGEAPYQSAAARLQKRKFEYINCAGANDYVAPSFYGIMGAITDLSACAAAAPAGSVSTTPIYMKDFTLWNTPLAVSAQVGGNLCCQGGRAPPINNPRTGRVYKTIS